MLRPPVILDAITTFSRRDLSLAIHEPMMRSVSPSGRCLSDGIGYCSAVSIRFTPPSRMALSIILWHSASSGPLKSAEPHRWVPRPISLTMMSPPPSRFCLMPLTVRTTSLVAPAFSDFGIAAEAAPTSCDHAPPMATVEPDRSRVRLGTMTLAAHAGGYENARMATAVYSIAPASVGSVGTGEVTEKVRSRRAPSSAQLRFGFG